MVFLCSGGPVLFVTELLPIPEEGGSKVFKGQSLDVKFQETGLDNIPAVAEGELLETDKSVGKNSGSRDMSSIQPAAAVVEPPAVLEPTKESKATSSVVADSNSQGRSLRAPKLKVNTSGKGRGRNPKAKKLHPNDDMALVPYDSWVAGARYSIREKSNRIVAYGTVQTDTITAGKFHGVAIPSGYVPVVIRELVHPSVSLPIPVLLDDPPQRTLADAIGCPVLWTVTGVIFDRKSALRS